MVPIHTEHDHYSLVAAMLVGLKRCDTATGLHSRRVGRNCVLIGRNFQLSSADLIHLRWADARIAVSRFYGMASAPFAAVIGFATGPNHAEPLVDHLNRLEAYLARIDAEVRAAGVATSAIEMAADKGRGS